MKVLLAAREEFTKFHPRNRSSITIAGFCRKDGSFGENGNTACHAGIKNYGEVGDLAIYTRHQGPTKKDKNIDMFYHYLMYDSPWASIFVKPKVRDVVQDAKEKGFILSTNHPNNMVAHACFASRLATENKSRVVSFAKLYELFKNKDLAFLVASFTIGSGNDYTFTGHKGHFHFASGLSKKYVTNFLKHNSRRDKLTINDTRHNYSVNDSFDTGGGGDYFVDYLKRFNPSGSSKSKYNIFDTKPKPVNTSIVFKERDFPALVKYVEKEFL